MTAWPHPSDVELLGLSRVEGGGTRFTLTPDVARGDNALYGGTAIAVSVAAMEATTQRPCLWVTTQFVSQAGLGDVIDCRTDVLASGRHLSQCQVTGRLGERILFVSLGSTATPRPGGLEGQYEEMPKVRGPESAEPLAFGLRSGANRDVPRPDRTGFHHRVEFRTAEPVEPAEGLSPLLLWGRFEPSVLSAPGMTRAGIAFLADMVPSAIVRAAGPGVGGGISLDNSLRFGSLPGDVGWILLELCGHMATGSHGHGTVKVWTEDGRLVAVGGQSANMRTVADLEAMHRRAGGAGSEG